LKAQEGKTAYKGLLDAFHQIARREGIRGFYKGFPISLLQVLSLLYIYIYGQIVTSFETVEGCDQRTQAFVCKASHCDSKQQRDHMLCSLYYWLFAPHERRCYC